MKVGDEEFRKEWQKAETAFQNIFGKEPVNLEAFLFVIGVQELGQGIRPFSKEEKQDLMHIATCSLLEKKGYYTLVSRDEEGWPHYELSNRMEYKKLRDQEELLKRCVVEYFYENGLME